MKKVKLLNIHNSAELLHSMDKIEKLKFVQSDIITLQGLGCSKRRSEVINTCDIAFHSFYSNWSILEQEKENYIQNSQLVTLSKYPIVMESFYPLKQHNLFQAECKDHKSGFF